MACRADAPDNDEARRSATRRRDSAASMNQDKMGMSIGVKGGKSQGEAKNVKIIGHILLSFHSY